MFQVISWLKGVVLSGKDVVSGVGIVVAAEAAYYL